MKFSNRNERCKSTKNLQSTTNKLLETGGGDVATIRSYLQVTWNQPGTRNAELGTRNSEPLLLLHRCLLADQPAAACVGGVRHS
jgi:hypothetical protein